jgi:hypothetical protein
LAKINSSQLPNDIAHSAKSAVDEATFHPDILYKHDMGAS